MIRYGVETKQHPGEVLQRARQFFGEEGLGLELVRQDDCCLYFEGAGGHVSITASEQDGRTQIDMVTREWEYDVRRFVEEIA